MKYNVAIIEELKKTVEVDADSYMDACQKVRADYVAKNIVLTAADRHRTSFHATVSVPETEKMRRTVSFAMDKSE